MKEILREFVIYQLLAIVLTLVAHPGSSFLTYLPASLIGTNCTAWSIRSIFVLMSSRTDFVYWRRPWQILFGVPAVAAGCLVGILLAAVPYELIYGQNILSRPVILSIFKGTLPWAAFVTVLMLAYYTLRARLESAALEQERLKGLRARAELASLRSKLNPHFLFNTLDSMLNLVHREPDKVEEMILGLSDIYRKVLQLPEGDRIALCDEFDLARQYLAIEQVRLGERLHFEIDLPEALRDRQVPPLFIQPLVENAVLHGLAPKLGGGKLRIAAELEEGALRIVVEDDGVGCAPGPDVSTAPGATDSSGTPGAGALEGSDGLGLASARERLRLLHGERGSLCLETPTGGGTRVILSVPDDTRETP